MDRAVSEYKLFDEIVKSVSDAKITKYERLDDGSLQSTFDNGSVIRVNTKTGEIVFNNKSVNMKDYGLGVARYE